MKGYEGITVPSGGRYVFVRENEKERTLLANGEYKFCWRKIGPKMNFLAYYILLDFFNREDLAEMFYAQFAIEIVSFFRQGYWYLSSMDIESWLQQWEFKE